MGPWGNDRTSLGTPRHVARFTLGTVGGKSSEMGCVYAESWSLEQWASHWFRWLFLACLDVAVPAMPKACANHLDLKS